MRSFLDKQLRNQLAVILFVADTIHSKSEDDFVCRLMNRIFDDKPTIVHHSIGNSTPVGEFTKCIEGYPGNASAFYTFNEDFNDAMKIQLDGNRTGVIIWPSSSEQVTISKMNFIAVNYYSWTSVFCYFFNITDLPPLLWISRCCDALLMSEGFLEVDRGHVVYERRRKDQQILIFSTGELNMPCNKCGIISEIIDLKRASVELHVFNKTLICTAIIHPDRHWYITWEVFNANTSGPRIGNATGGFEIRLLEDIRSHLGFKYYIQESPSMQIWGFVKNGSWEGVLGQVIYRKAHLALGDLSILHPRNLYFDFTYPHDFDFLAFVSKLEVRSLSSSVIIQLMDTGSWYCLLVLTILTCSFLAATSKFNKVRASVLSVVFHGAEFVYGALVQPSVVFPYRQPSGAQALLLTWTIGLFVLGRALSASLVTFIAAPGFGDILDTMSEWANFLQAHPDSRVCMLPGHYRRSFDPSSDEIMFREAAHIGEYVFQDCLSWSNPRVVEEIAVSKNVFWLSEQLHITAELNAAGLDMVHVSRDHFFMMDQGFILQKGCALSMVIQNLTRALFETGHIIHYKKQLNISELPSIIVEHTVSPLGLPSISGLVTTVMFIEAAMILVFLSELASLLRTGDRLHCPLYGNRAVV